MKLALSNLAWDAGRNEEIYEMMAGFGIDGLEIAPTKLFGDDPYGETAAGIAYADDLERRFGIRMVSMQSLWYGQKGRVFGDDAERSALLAYTKRAIDFAAVIGCGNLVFGSPKNRALGADGDIETAHLFFGAVGRYAAAKGAVLAIEPNPEIYGTDFLNTTREALDFCAAAGSSGLRVNLDFGTIIANGEELDFAKEDVALINHVHISEPNLLPIERRAGHRRLRELLLRCGYGGYVSVEMGDSGNPDDIVNAARYLVEVFQ